MKKKRLLGLFLVVTIVCQNFIGNNIVEAAERKDDSKHKNKDRKEESKMLDEIYEKLDANIVLSDDEVELLDYNMIILK